MRGNRLAEPRIVITESAPEAWRAAAQLLVDQVAEKPTSVLGLATGRTMRGVYEEAVRLSRTKGVDWSAVQTFNLDEYIGLAADHPASFHAFMRQMLFLPLSIPLQHTHFPALPAGVRPVPGMPCEDYDAAIAEAGGLDLQILGIGRNGHIGFNEPGSPFASRTRVVRLTEATRRQNAATFPPGEEVPRLAVTAGIATILAARRIVLVATGTEKRQAVAAALGKRPDPAVPASALLLHPAVTWILDTAAAQGLS